MLVTIYIGKKKKDYIMNHNTYRVRILFFLSLSTHTLSSGTHTSTWQRGDHTVSSD